MGNAYLQVAVYLKKFSLLYFDHKVKQFAKLDRISGMYFMNAYKSTDLRVHEKLNSHCSFNRMRKCTVVSQKHIIFTIMLYL